MRSELAEKDMPEESLSGIDEHINAMVGQRLTELAHELVEESALPDEHRSNELENTVRWALRRLIERIDQGYTVDVRTPEVPPEEPADEQGAEEDAAKSRAQLLAIRELADNIRRLDPQGQRILQLPGGDEPPELEESTLRMTSSPVVGRSGLDAFARRSIQSSSSSRCRRAWVVIRTSLWVTCSSPSTDSTATA